MAAKKQLVIWNTEITREADGSVRMVAKNPLSHMSVKQAAKILGLSEWTVTDLYRLGLVKGFKPGARVIRTDGKASNARLCLDSASVLRYKERQQQAASDWQAGRDE